MIVLGKCQAACCDSLKGMLTSLIYFSPLLSKPMVRKLWTTKIKVMLPYLALSDPIGFLVQPPIFTIPCLANVRDGARILLPHLINEEVCLGHVTGHSAPTSFHYQDPYAAYNITRSGLRVVAPVGCGCNLRRRHARSRRADLVSVKRRH